MIQKTGMNNQAGAWKTMLALIIVLVMMSMGTVFAQDIEGDNLQLSGTLKSIDLESGYIVVDVKTEGCLGERTFKIDSSQENEAHQENGADDETIGKKIEFFIDSYECTNRAIYKIIPMEREEKGEENNE